MTYLNPLFVVLVTVIAIGLLTGGRRARLFGGAALMLLVLWNWPPAVSIFAVTLERWYPSEPAGKMELTADAGAIVVLSGDVETPEPHRPITHLGPATEIRLEHALWLYRKGRRLPILVTGGITKGQRSIGSIMADRLRAEGIPPEHILLEGAAANTHQNAVFSARILRDRGIGKVLLVTEAYHMLRSEKCFRKQGIEVVPAPCAYRTLELDWQWLKLFPDAKAARQNDEIMHEWIGLIAYRLQGRF